MLIRMGRLMYRSNVVRTQQLVASAQVPVNVSPMRTVLDVPSLMSAMLT